MTTFENLSEHISVKIELTDIGLEKWKQVVRLVFDYLGMLQRLEPNKRYWNELLQRKEIIFNHQGHIPSIKIVNSLVPRMFEFAPEDIISAKLT